MRRPISILLLCACSALLMSRLAGAQATTGSILGQVTDQSKAVIPGAGVTATNQQTGVVYAGQTDQNGQYAIHALPPAVYRVQVSKNGFQVAEVTDETLVIDQKLLLNFELKVGATSEVVTVKGTPAALQTQSAETGTVIETEDIVDLPLLGRNFYSLPLLAPGVTTVGANNNAVNLSVNGSREFANSIEIDGVESLTNRTQDISVTPSVDSVQEFKVSTSDYNAELGRSGGGVITIQTKSGTNNFHGTAYEFFRPNFLEARDYSFGPKSIPSQIKQHNYGGTLGGPIKKDRMFFFISYEGLTNTNAFTEIASTPPMQMISILPDGSVDLSRLEDPFTGNITPIFDPAVSIACGGTCSQQFPGNIIPANRVSKAGLNTLLNFFPKPNLAGTGHGFFRNFQVDSPVNQNNRTGDSRFDYNVSSNNRLAVAYHYGDGNILVTDPYHGATVVPGAGDADQANHETLQDQELSVTETHVLSNKALNEARFGWTRNEENLYSLLNGQDLSDKYGVGNITVPGFPATLGYPFIDLVSGYLAGGSTFKPFLQLDTNFEYADNFTLSQIGKHDFKFGGDFRRLNSHPDFSLFPTGFQFYGFPFANITGDPTFTFFDPNSFWGNGGSDIADLLLGAPLDVAIGLQLTKPHTQSWEMHFFGQDSYRVTPRLTLNYGLRYEYQAPYTEEHNFASNFDPTFGLILLAARGHNSATLMNSRWNDVSPRFGIAYQIDPKTVVRGGYGIFFSPENDGREDFLTKNLPFADQATYNNGNTAPFQYQLDAGVPRVSTVNIPAGASSIDPATVKNSAGQLIGPLEKTFYVNPNLKTGNTQQFNLSIERQLAHSLTVDTAYVGSRSHHLSYQLGNINFPTASGNNALTNSLGVIQALQDFGQGSYDSLQIKFTKRESRNLSFLGSYTYSHNIDNGPAPFDLGVNNDNPQNPGNLRAEIASSDFDVRHNFVFSGLYRLPIGRGQAFFGNWSPTMETLLGGWQINSIFAMSTGTPVNVVRGSSNPQFPGLRPDIVGDPTIPRGQRTLVKYFNTAAFSTTRFSCPTCNANAFGDAGRNLLTGPGNVNLDFSVFKEFAPSEKIKLQTRIEMFNIMNTPHFNNPDGFMTDGTFGSITGTHGNQRIVQLDAKIIF